MRLFCGLLFGMILIALAWLPTFTIEPQHRLITLRLLLGSPASWLVWLAPYMLGMCWASYADGRYTSGTGWLMGLLALPFGMLAFIINMGFGSGVPAHNLLMGVASCMALMLQAVGAAVLWVYFGSEDPPPLWFAGVLPALILSLAGLLPAMDYCVLEARQQKIDAVPMWERQAWAADLLEDMAYEPYPGSAVIEESLVNYPLNYSQRFTTSAAVDDVLVFHRRNAENAGLETYFSANSWSPAGHCLQVYDADKNYLLEVIPGKETEFTLSVCVDNKRVIDYWKRTRRDYQP